MTDQVDTKTLDAVRSIVLKESETLDDKNFTRIRGYEFNKGVDLMGLISSMASTGFQASNLGDAVEVVNQMVSKFRLLKKMFFFRKDEIF